MTSWEVLVLHSFLLLLVRSPLLIFVSFLFTSIRFSIRFLNVVFFPFLFFRNYPSLFFIFICVFTICSPYAKNALSFNPYIQITSRQRHLNRIVLFDSSTLSSFRSFFSEIIRLCFSFLSAFLLFAHPTRKMLYLSIRKSK